MTDPNSAQHFTTSSNDELWGTFAVDDHLRKRAFVAEVVLFDRLVVPEPPDKDQYEEWTKAGWEPDRLKKMIDRLGDLAVPVPWDKPLRAKWRAEYESISAAERAALRMNLTSDALSDFKDIKQADPSLPAMWVTRRVIARKLEDGFGALDPVADDALYQKIKALDIDPTAHIEAVVGYGSYTRFREEIPVDLAQGPVSAGQDTALLFQWDFLVPEDSDLSDDELLRRAIDLSRKKEFRDSRRQFHEWRRKLISKRVDIETARSEMSRCLAVYNDIVAKARVRSRALMALQILAATASLGDVVLPGLGMAGSVTFGVAALLAERLFPQPVAGAREKVAALVHDSREKFGWHDR